MPRLTEATRRARRDAIADAALRVFERRGVAHASTADIIEELGGSAGGMYSHFASKAELVRFIAQRELSRSLETLAPEDLGPRPPAEIARAALKRMTASTPTRLIVQLWGEAMVDDEIRAVVLETLDQVEASLQRAMLPWAQTMPGDADDRATQTAAALRAITQGYIVQLALFGQTEADQYLDCLAAALTTDSSGEPRAHPLARTSDQ